MQKIKVGIVGTGYTIGIAADHVKGFRNNANMELVGLYDIVPGRAKQWAVDKEVVGVQAVDSLEELFAMVDAISICVPNADHIDVGIKALEAKKHFICEKPISIDYKEGKRLVDHADKHGDVVSMICFNYRDIPAMQYAKKIMDDGLIGRVHSCTQQIGGARIANPVDVRLEWRMDKNVSGHGALADFGCHALDLADFLLSEDNGKIKEVQCFTNNFIQERKLLDSEEKGKVTNDDCAVFNAKTEGGTLLSFIASRMGVPFQTLQITGEGGMLYFDGRHHDELGIQFKSKDGGYTEPFRTEKVPAAFLNESGHSGIVNEFANAILHGAPVQRTLARGLYIQNIIEQIAVSARLQKTVQL